MKLLFVSLLFTIIFFLFSCSNDDNENNIVTDYDGNIYQTVTIGTQVWMAENLKTTHYRNGTAIPNVTDSTAWSNLTTGAYCDFDNILSNSTTYGRLYNWYAVSNTNNIAPAGWHVASDSDWTTLTTYLGGQSVAGGKLKEAGFAHWLIPNTGATNETDFTALPGGYRTIAGNFNAMGGSANWWSSTEYDATNAWYRYLFFAGADVGRSEDSKRYGISVRCVKDN